MAKSSDSEWSGSDSDGGSDDSGSEWSGSESDEAPKKKRGGAKRPAPPKRSARPKEDKALQRAIAASLEPCKSGEGGGSSSTAGPSDQAPSRPEGWREAPKNHTGNYSVEYAKTGRAKCGVCGELIPHRSLRIGLEVEESGWGVITRWQHLDCTRLPSAFCEAALADESELTGLDELLTEADTARVREMLAATSPVAALCEVEVDKEVEASASLWTTQREPPATLTAQMLPYQKEGLGWLCAQEEGPIGGGILADEMGMGKTLQAISLLLERRSTDWVAGTAAAADAPARKGKGKAPMSATAIAAPAPTPEDVAEAAVRQKLVRGGTLVVVPVIALKQWEAEIKRWTAAGTLTVCSYHGPKRESLPDVLARYDVVLTTYNTVEYDFRIAQAELQVKCAYCSRKFKNDQKLAFHHKWFCGPTAKRSSAQSKTRKRKKRSSLASMMLGEGEQEESDEEESDEEEDDDDEEEDDDDDNGKRQRGAGGAAKAAKGAKGSKAVAKAGAKGAKAAATGNRAKAKAVAKDAPTKGGAKGEDVEMVVMPGNGGKGGKGGAGKGDAKKKKMPAKKGSGGGGGGGGGDDDDEDEEGEEGEGGGGGGDDDELEAKNVRAQRAKERREKLERVAQKSTLHRLHWFRIILDEAHAIKDRRCSTAQSMMALHAQHRWCLSGTPLQNRVGELYSLVAFLRLEPHAYYFCKAPGCNCKCREYRFDANYSKCEYCGHGPVQHYSRFNRDVVNPIRKYGYIGAGRNAFVTLKREVFDKSLLRRTKEGRAQEMVLPPKLITLEANFLDDTEMDFYQAIYTQSQAEFGAYVQAGTLLNNYAHIFDLLTRLRQSVDHPYLVMHSKRAIEEGGGGAAATPSAPICNLCYEDATDPVASSPCGHAFCRECIRQYVDSCPAGAPLTCASCSLPLSVDLNDASPAAGSPEADGASRARRGITPEEPLTQGGGGGGGGGGGVRLKGILGRLDMAQFRSSTKMEALMEELHAMSEADPAAKAIVFSQFVSFLDLLEYRIQRAGIKVVKLNGGMSVAAREGVLNSFKDDFGTKVILISLKAGGVALNLTVASHIYLMDPWWNPAAEYQAIDRAHRLGQHKPIRAVRFVVRNTVEERIIRLQDKKRLVFEGTVGGDIGSLSQLSEDDLRFLFQN